MSHRTSLMTALMFACLSLIGCGGSGTANEDLPPMTAADLAAAQADIDRVNEAEKSQGGVTPPSVRRKARSSEDSEASNSRSLSGGR